MMSIVSSRQSAPSRAIPTVLVVDDDDAVRDLVEAILSDEGFRVHTANNGQAALRSIAAARPDVVLMDVNMPRLDGISACRMLHADARTADLPVIIMSARPVGSPQLHACRADGFLSKPFDIDRLVAEVAAFAGLPERHD